MHTHKHSYTCITYSICAAYSFIDFHCFCVTMCCLGGCQYYYGKRTDTPNITHSSGSIHCVMNLNVIKMSFYEMRCIWFMFDIDLYYIQCCVYADESVKLQGRQRSRMFRWLWTWMRSCQTLFGPRGQNRVWHETCWKVRLLMYILFIWKMLQDWALLLLQCQLYHIVYVLMICDPV